MIYTPITMVNLGMVVPFSLLHGPFFPVQVSVSQCAFVDCGAGMDCGLNSQLQATYRTSRARPSVEVLSSRWVRARIGLCLIQGEAAPPVMFVVKSYIHIFYSLYTYILLHISYILYMLYSI